MLARAARIELAIPGWQPGVLPLALRTHYGSTELSSRHTSNIEVATPRLVPGINSPLSRIIQLLLVSVRGLEPRTFCTQNRRATRLRYTEFIGDL